MFFCCMSNLVKTHITHMTSIWFLSKFVSGFKCDQRLSRSSVNSLCVNQKMFHSQSFESERSFVTWSHLWPGDKSPAVAEWRAASQPVYLSVLVTRGGGRGQSCEDQSRHHRTERLPTSNTPPPTPPLWCTQVTDIAAGTSGIKWRFSQVAGFLFFSADSGIKLQIQSDFWSRWQFKFSWINK